MRKAMWSAATVVVLLAAVGMVGGYTRAGAATNSVSMVEGPGDPTTDWKFDPADITVPAGTTVKWHNSGKQPHTVTADDGSFNSSSISPGGDFEHAFPAPGNYAYHSDPHPWMKAVVHVAGGASPTTAPPATPTTQAAPTGTTVAPTPKQSAAVNSTTATAPGASSTTTSAPAVTTTTA